MFIAAQDGETLAQYDWELDKPCYIALLREHDVHRNPRHPRHLAAFIAVRPLGE